jgi:predicted ArsR family transcriptional regulator
MTNTRRIITSLRGVAVQRNRHAGFFLSQDAVLALADQERTILTVDQLPDSRRAILHALKRQGACTISRLAEELRLTGEAVRQQLLQLQREGWVDAKTPRNSERGRTGRPATSYTLSEAGDHLFPKNYDLLNVALIDAIGEELGAEAAARVLRRVYETRVALAEGALQGMTLEQKVEALRGLYFESDPFMDVERVDGGDFRLVERNCPYFNTAMRRPVLCSVSVNALTKLLGVRVDREEKFQRGDGRCVFRIRANQPVSDWEFRLES